MSAVPQKKLCWNCEGNVAKNVDNCPYCGVYLHAEEIEEDSNWNSSPSFSSRKEEIPPPLYQIQTTIEKENIQEEATPANSCNSTTWHALFAQIKQDVFPLLFLMMGSVFFLFGIVLLLFSQNDTFTLQWQKSDGIFFLILAFPLVGFGWMFLQQLEPND